jgi:hypothetical protein
MGACAPNLGWLFSVSSVSSLEETEEAEEAQTFGRGSSPNLERGCLLSSCQKEEDVVASFSLLLSWLL